MSQLDPRIEAVRAQYGLAREDFWQIKQNKQWVCKHAALEIVAVKAKIEWFPPTIIEANSPENVTSMIVTGKMGERVEWATGETNKSNYRVTGNQPAYPWAMSEKRAKDRVVLKLVGIHGLVYSEDEAEDFRGSQPGAPAPEPNQQPKTQAKTPTHPASFDDHSLMVELRAISSMHGLKSFWLDNIGTFKAMGQEALDAFTSAKNERKAAIEATPKPKQPDTVDDILDTFPGSTVTNERIVNTQGRELHPLEGM